MSEVERKCDDCNSSSDVFQKCESCDIFLCIRCGKTHPDRKHKILNLEKDEVVKPILKIKQCKYHKDRDISNFCLNCQIPVCSTCISKPEHKGHLLEENETIYMEREKELKEYADTFESYFLPHFSREQERLDQISKSHQDIMEEEKQKIIDQEEELKEEIRKQAKTLIEGLEIKWKNNLVKDISSEKDCLDIDIICELKKEIEDFEKNVDLSYLQLPLEGKKYKRGPLDQNQKKSIVGSLENFSMQNIIDFRVLQTFITDTEPIESISVKEDDTIWANSKDKAVRKMEIHKEIKTGKKLPEAASAIAITQSGDLLLAVVNDTSSIKKLKKSSGNLKVFYSHQGSFRKTPFSATALHVQTNGNILVGFKNNNPGKEAYQKIITLSPNGRELRELKLAFNGKSLCTIPYRLTTNDNDDICIVDHISENEGQIVVIDKCDDVKWRYPKTNPGEIPNKFFPNGIVTTSQNNFIVSDERNNALHVLK
ncbi:unnamed protein product [Mytilus edulis]|uniref:B box-type domain-containing protein n=1 Tax=Mytilus edulis TaxID=6550 RepID=A0A8S3RVP9_MYTED|nr:unnamed protein product [Mytilus edulis]